MATKSKKKVKTTTKQKQKQTQKQNVVVNINTTKTTKKKSKKQQSNKSPETNRPLRPTAQTAYNRVITQSQPMLIQQIPNNNDLIGAIQQLTNKFQQPTPPAPVQYNPALYENTVQSLNELNETLKNKKSPKPQSTETPPLQGFFNNPPPRVHEQPRTFYLQKFRYEVRTKNQKRRIRKLLVCGDPDRSRSTPRMASSSQRGGEKSPANR